MSATVPTSMYWSAFKWRELLVYLSVSLHMAERLVDAAFSVLETVGSQTTFTLFRRRSKYDWQNMRMLISLT